MMDPATDSYELNVAVEGGTVTLTGKAQSWAERSLASDVARGVSGVKSVDNEVEVRYVERPDSEIEQDVLGRLQQSVWIDSGAIVADVDAGVVTLTGAVGSAAEKRLAASLAYVDGVRRVDDSGLEVRWWARDEMQRKSPVAMTSDDDIEQAVNDAFLFDPRVYSFQPHVEAADGVVTLTGTVDNLRAKQAAEADAHNTVGVWRVRNHLRVRNTDNPTDAEIDQRVTQALKRNPYVERHEIDPVVVNQKVYLYGTVDSLFERRQAGTVAASVNGVASVDNRLDIAPTFFSSNERELQSDIEDALWWSPYVDSNDVTVTVDGDTAVLTGTVDDWRAWSKASEYARDCGARSVINRLDVRGFQDTPR